MKKVLVVCCFVGLAGCASTGGSNHASDYRARAAWIAAGEAMQDAAEEMRERRLEQTRELREDLRDLQRQMDEDQRSFDLQMRIDELRGNTGVE
ncbi:hypothetical protein [Candidatus Methylacidithermus pantelleriae]|uniref:Lipoprotein n=1 Tax=Candidatus Methylacidithermus pantelleriae TaxID=2744239 RepID=A0A8J2BMZ7_9BACT|nr:hypothetical protein [Candidatus Methylacidithermus pantelleriae]CAF0700567.1 hypothetical protein MPNT_380015 [Candidatus Methylacidithermus pantelleriae]